jgi:aryl-phospho-beta-D-glucosidase BglC (GH1 family)
MKATLTTLAAIGLATFCLQTATAQDTNAPAPTGDTNAPKIIHSWWRTPAPGQRRYSVNNKQMPLISVKGNKFVDPDGKTVLFRGIDISDPDKLEMQGHWGKEYFEKIHDMGAMLVRIPVHPAAWRGRTPVEYIKLLDQAVGWCTDLNMYVIIDWHTIGNLETGLFQDPPYETTKQETFNFWRVMARHYAGHNTVAFFELFNEPTTYRGQLGPVSWADWKKTVETEITIIRGYDQQVIPLVAGFDWAYDLTPVHEAPIAADGIGYTVHPYSNKRSKPWQPKWEEDFGFVAEKYPVFATEFGGFARPAATDTEPSAEEPSQEGKATSTYGESIIKYLESKGISWSVWCFDPEWGPTLIKNWHYDLNASGEFAKQALHGEVK